MRSNCEDEILREYNLAHSQGRIYRAAQAIGSLSEQGNHKAMSLAMSLIQSWSAKDKDLVIASVLNSLQRAARIVAVGERFTYEEILQLLTLRFEAQLGLSAARLVSLPIEEAQEIALVLDDDLRQIFRLEINRTAFRQAQKSIRKNWTDRFPGHWLDLDFSF